MWYERLIADPTNQDILAECIEYYESELDDAKKEIIVKGKLQDLSAKMPSIVEHRYAQLQELESVLKFYEIRYNEAKGLAFRAYLESKNTALALSSRDAEKFAECDKDVVGFADIIIYIELIRNKYSSILKGLDVKGFQLNNIIKLRCAGLEDATI